MCVATATTPPAFRGGARPVALPSAKPTIDDRLPPKPLYTHHRNYELSLSAMKTETRLDPNFVLKIAAPSSKGWIIARSWTARLFDRVRNHRFVAVHAHGGYGKTTLLVEWRRQLLRNREFVGWLTLDERDDASRFLYGLIACLREATGNAQFGHDAIEAARAAGGEVDAMTTILAGISVVAHPIAILLDDAHLLPETTARTLLPYLVHNLPANLQLVAGARGPLEVPTGELAARGEFVSLGLDDLRLRLDETIECLRARFGARFDVDACARIHEAVEGWPIALGMAIAILEQQPTAGAGIIARNPRDVGLFFTETVLDRLEPHAAAFVIATSILDALHPDLCRAMTDSGEANVLLDSIQKATPILAASEGGDWLRMHPLARRAFADQFALLPTSKQRDLHWRAARWLNDAGDVEAAARHAMAAERPDEAYQWIGLHLLKLAYRGHIAEVLAWAEKLPPNIASHADTALAIGWAQTLSYLPGAAADTVRHLVAAKSEDVRYEAGLIVAVNALYADDPGRAAKIMHGLKGSSLANAERWRQIHANVVTYILIEGGEAERARHLQSLARHNDDESADLAQWHGDFIVALSYLHEARPRLAERVLRPAMDRAEAARGRRSASASILGAALGAALWEQNHRVEAESALAYRLDVVERTAVPEGIAIIYVTLARIASAAGEEDRALDLLQRLHSIGEVRGLPRLILTALAEQIRLHAAFGRAEGCVRLADRLDDSWTTVRRGLDRSRAAKFGILYRMGRARACIVDYDFDSARTLLEEAGALARQLNLNREVLESRLLLAMIRSPDEPDAIASIRECLSIAERDGLMRLFVEAHPGMLQRVRLLMERGDTRDCGASEAFLNSLLDIATVQPRRELPNVLSASRKRTAAAVPALLTATEARVLDHVAQGMGNKEIARALELAPETVKWHLKGIFAKLNAGSRRHAVDRARMLDLI
jgi:LuxR family maltose regulon positive regulatory protein